MALAYKPQPGELTSVCPECMKPLEARFEFTPQGVFIAKTCPAHGEFRDLFYRHPEMFERAMAYMKWHEPPEPNPNCPNDCGPCTAHASPHAILNIDLTNACNLHCPFCFAAAEKKEEQFWPDRDQIRKMLEVGVKNRGHMAGVQFSGGEPTLSPYFMDAISMARDLGYYWTQAVTNGIKFGKSLEFTLAAKKAGLRGLYLQFDGVEDRIWRATRGRDLMAVKEQVMENCRKAGISVTLVVTLAKGVNDDQLGKILDFAIKHIHAVVGLSFQPLAFTGRVPYEERIQKRYTISDLAYDLERQTGGRIQALRDFVPLSATQPISQFADLFRPTPDTPKATLCSCHPLCGMGTYILVNSSTGEYYPLPQLFDWDGILQELHGYAAKKKDFGHSKILGALKLAHTLWRFKKKGNASFPAWKLVRVFDAMTGGRTFRVTRKKRYEWRLLLAAGMHFMDNYNFLTDRAQSCVIQYATPDGRLIPFCTYNSGPNYRREIEEKYRRPGNS